jgi:hypothetical protein
MEESKLSLKQPAKQVSTSNVSNSELVDRKIWLKIENQDQVVVATVAAATVAITTAMKNAKVSARAKKAIALVPRKNLNGKNG